MNRLKASNSVPFASRDLAPVSGTPQYATDGVPGSFAATDWPAYMFNMMQDELCAVPIAAGLTLDDTNPNQVWQGLFRALTFQDSGAVNALAVALPAGLAFPVSALGFGMSIGVRAANTNTQTAPTLNAFGSGVKTILHGDGSAIIPGEIQIGQFHQFIYDGSNWRLVWRELGASNSPLRLSTNLDVYVNATTGSDNNTGLSASSPFLTLQKAWNYVQTSLDLNGFVVTVHVSAGGPITAGVVALGAPLGATGPGSVIFSFDPGTSVQIAAGSPFVAIGSAAFTVQATGASVTLIGNGSATNQGYGVLANNGGRINLGANVVFGASAVAAISTNGVGANVSALNNFTVSGGAQYFLYAVSGGQIVLGPVSAITVTASGSPAFSVSTANASVLASIVVNLCTFSGAATGSRYAAASNAVINTGGGGATAIFGNAGGTTTTGGQYV